MSSSFYMESTIKNIDDINYSILYNILFPQNDNDLTILAVYLKQCFSFCKQKEIDFLTFYNYLNLPYFISEKTFFVFSNKNKTIETSKLIDCIIALYFGNLSTRIHFITLLLSENKNNLIYFEDVKHFFLTFHYLHNNNEDNEELEKMGYSIIHSFFEGKNDMSTFDFSNKLKSSNSDLFYLFMSFFMKNQIFTKKSFEHFKKKFYNKKQLEILENKTESKSLEQIQKIPLPSSALLEYLQIKLKFPFEFNEDLLELNNFENQVHNTIEFDGNLMLEIKIERNKTQIFNYLNLNNLRHKYNLTNKENDVALKISKSSPDLLTLENYQTFEAYFLRHDEEITKYNIDISSDDIFIYSNDGTIKIFYPLKHLYLETFPTDLSNINKKTINRLKQYFPLHFYSSLNNKMQRCTLFFEKESTIKEITDIVKANVKFKPFDNKRFLDQTILGQGAFGHIIKAFDKILNQTIILKMIHKDYSNLEIIKLIRNEQDISLFLQKRSHKNVVKVYEIFETTETVIIELEYICEGSLTSYLSRTYLTTNQQTDLIKQLAQAIEYLHYHGIVHRDLKPENILIDKKDMDLHIKIIDFGLSKMHCYTETMTEQCGTLLYLPPEILMHHKYTSKTDIWNFGLISYAILNGGIHPFAAELETKKLADKIISRKFTFEGIENKYKELLSACLQNECARADIRTVMKLIQRI